MNELHVAALTLHQRAAPLDARERFLALVAPLGGAADRLALTTCHRVELYVALPDDADPRAWAERVLGLGWLDPLWESLVCLRGADAVRHVLRVTAGLDSAIAGEPQIARQVRDALASAAAPHPLLRRLFEHALYVGRTLRRTTSLGGVRRSVGSLAVDEIVRRLDGPERATVAVVGAGEMGKLSVRALRGRVGSVVIANRDRARAEATASAGDRVVDLTEVPSVVAEADAIISAADTRGRLFTRELLRERVARRPLVLVDIAVPRSVEVAARNLEGLIYRTVDDLIDEAPSISMEELAGADERCAREAELFMGRVAQRRAAGAIRELRANAERIRADQVARALRRLGHLDQRDREEIDALSVRLTNALLHDVTVDLKEES